MKISATITSAHNTLETGVKTGETSHYIPIEPKASGYGSSINGAELLMLSLATCFCNDLYREAAKRNIEISSVEVTTTGEFGAEGEPGTNFKYSAIVKANVSEADIQALVRHTDSVAEVHNTLRKGLTVTLEK